MRWSRARLVRPAGRRACRKHRQLVFDEKLLGDGEAKELLCIGNGGVRRRVSSPSGAPALGRKKGSLNRRRAQPTCRSLLLVDLRRAASSSRHVRWKHSIEAFRSGWGDAGAGRDADRGATSPAAFIGGFKRRPRQRFSLDTWRVCGNVLRRGRRGRRSVDVSWSFDTGQFRIFRWTGSKSQLNLGKRVNFAFYPFKLGLPKQK